MSLASGVDKSRQLTVSGKSIVTSRSVSDTCVMSRSVQEMSVSLKDVGSSGRHVSSVTK